MNTFHAITVESGGFYAATVRVIGKALRPVLFVAPHVFYPVTVKTSGALTADDGITTLATDDGTISLTSI